jgi:hypothetical protein
VDSDAVLRLRDSERIAIKSTGGVSSHGDTASKQWMAMESSHGDTTSKQWMAMEPSHGDTASEQWIVRESSHGDTTSN